MQIDLAGTPVFAATGGREIAHGQPTVIFVHGAGMDHTVWSLQTRYFAHHGFSVLAPDLPGHGRSGGSAIERIEEMAVWLLGLADSIKAGGLYLVGHSMGSLIALEAAKRGGERVVKTALLGVVPEMKVHPSLIEAALQDPPAAHRMMVGWGIGRRASRGGNTAPGLWLSGGSRQLLAAGAGEVLATDLRACDSYSGAMAAASEITGPVLVLTGEDDRMTPPGAAGSLIEALRDGKTEMLRATGHMMMLEEPDQVLDCLRDFLGDGRMAA